MASTRASPPPRRHLLRDVLKVTPEFGDRFAACMVDRAKAQGASPEAIAETAKQAQVLKRLYDNPATNAALTFVQPFPIGLLASLISAAILRKRPE